MINNLFIYGTLAPGRPNEHVLADVEGQWQEASVRGFLREEGWGAELGFPGIDLDPEGPIVDGFLFSSQHLAEHWQRLDAFEGSAYERVVTVATLPDGSGLAAYIYALRTA